MSSAVEPSTGRHRPERIFVGIDGSLVSRTALRWAVEHARAGDTVVLVHVWSPSPAMVGAGFGEEDGDKAARALVQHEIMHVRALADESGVVLESLAPRGNAQTYLRDVEADLLVLGACGRGQVAGRLLGSVSYHLARHCHTPLVIVPVRSQFKESDSESHDGAVRT